MSTDKANPTPTRGVVINSLDRPRFIRYSLKTRKEIRLKFGEDVLNGTLSDDRLVEVILEGLRGDDPTLTAEQLEDLIDMENLPEVMAAFTKAMGGRGVVTLPEGAAPNPQTPAVAE